MCVCVCVCVCVCEREREREIKRGEGMSLFLCVAFPDFPPQFPVDPFCILSQTKHGRRFVCYSYICFYSFIPRFQQIATRTNTYHYLHLLFLNRGFVLDEYSFWKTNSKFEKQILNLTNKKQIFTIFGLCLASYGIPFGSAN